MFNSQPFNRVEFNRIMEIIPWHPGGFPLTDPNNFHLMYDTDIVPVEYIGEQHSYSNNPWSPHAGFQPNQWLYTADLNLYFAGDDGYVYNFGTGDTDAGNKIEAYYVTKDIDLDVPDRVKISRWIDIDCDIEPGSILKVYFRIDGETEWRPLAEIDQGSGRYLFAGMPKIQFRKIALKFANGYLGCKFKINSFTLDMVIHGQQKEMI